MDADAVITGLLADAGDRLLRLAFQLCHDRLTAEDIVQQALEHAYRRWRRSRVAVTDAEAYVRRAVVNEFLRRRRVRSATELITDSPAEQATPPPDNALVERDAMWHALAALPAWQRAALVLRYYEDLPDGEIARLLACRDATVRSLVARGLQALRTQASATTVAESDLR